MRIVCTFGDALCLARELVDQSDFSFCFPAADYPFRSDSWADDWGASDLDYHLLFVWRYKGIDFWIQLDACCGSWYLFVGCGFLRLNSVFASQLYAITSDQVERYGLSVSEV